MRNSSSVSPSNAVALVFHSSSNSTNTPCSGHAKSTRATSVPVLVEDLDLWLGSGDALAARTGGGRGTRRTRTSIRAVGEARALSWVVSDRRPGPSDGRPGRSNSAFVESRPWWSRLLATASDRLDRRRSCRSRRPLAQRSPVTRTPLSTRTSASARRPRCCTNPASRRPHLPSVRVRCTWSRSMPHVSAPHSTAAETWDSTELGALSAAPRAPGRGAGPRARGSPTARRTVGAAAHPVPLVGTDKSRDRPV